MKSRVVRQLGVIAGHKKRSVVIAGQKKSINLEQAFWRSLEEIASYRDVTVPALLAAINAKPRQGTLPSAIRLFIVSFYREQLAIRGGPRGDPSIELRKRLRQ
jgi:predicted DNA-binding ribbon-helix-helix protein